MKAVLVINYASEEDIGKKTSIHLLNEENEWVEDVVIKPLPQKKVPHFDPNASTYDEERERSIMNEIDGYNRCIDEITGEV